MKAVSVSVLGALALGLALAPAPARAVSLSLSPALITASGSSFSVDLVIAGLGAAGAPSVGAFDVDVAFDPGFLSFGGASFGAALGSIPGDALTSVLSSAGLVDLAELSLLLPPQLDALQPADSFALATLSFNVLPSSLGATALSFGSSLISDAFGRALVVESATGASVALAPAIPEPSAFLVFAVGLAALSRGSWRDPR
jgi:hypothetical protein